MEDQAVIKFNCKLPRDFSKLVNLIKLLQKLTSVIKIVYRDDCLSYSKVFELYRRFK